VGKYVGNLRSGCHVVNPCCVELKRVNTNLQSMQLQKLQVIDREGTPIHISGVVAWRVVSPRSASLDVEDAFEYVRAMCVGAIKATIALYPFEHPDQESVRTHADVVTAAITARANELVRAAGASIIRVSLTDMAYAPEIASAMLVRQQAGATIKARKVIVEGAVTIADGAVRDLEAKGHAFTAEERSEVIGNLLTVLCSEHGVRPFISM